MKTRGISIAVIGGVVMVIATMACQGRKDSDEKDKVEMAKAAKITVDQAIKTATDKTPGVVIEAELEKKDGKVVWEVEVVTTEGKTAEIHVDADSGVVMAEKK